MAELRFPVEIDDSQASKELNKLVTKIDKLKQSIAKSEAARTPIVEQLKEAQDAATEAAAKVEELKAVLASEKGKLEFARNNGELKATEWVESQTRQKHLSDELAEQERILQAQNAEVSNLQTKADKLRTTLEAQTAELKESQTAAGDLTRTISEASDAQKLKAAFEGVKTSISGGVKSLLKWGIGIRSLYVLLRKLRQYIVEAVKSFAENDPETKANINELKNALAGLKASWGAAFAPVLNAVVPILKTLISWLTAAANAIAAFFAALSGKGTYKKAVASTGELSSNLGGAADNAKDAKKQLMGIDELNVMNDTDTSGSGGGGGGSGGGLEYEDVPISEGLLKNLELIKDLVLGIAAGIAGWRIASRFTDDLKTIIGVALMFSGIVIAIKGGLDAWANGVNWQNLIEIVGSVALAAVGAALAFGKIGGAITLLIGGIAMLVIGIRDWVLAGELSDETCWLIIAGLTAVGVAISILTGSWIPLIIAAVAAAALAIYNYWDEIKTWFAELWNDIRENQRAVWEQMKEDWNELKSALANVWNNVKTTAISTWGSIKTTVTSMVNTLKNSIVEKFNALKTSLSNIVGNIKSQITSKLQALLTAAKSINWADIGISIVNGIITGLNNGWQWLVNAVSNICNSLLNTAKSILGIHSPSTVFRDEVGENVGAGIEEGLENSEGGIMTRLKDIAADMLTGFDGAQNRMTSQLADIGNIPMPAVAMGTVVPPNATSGGYAYSALESKIDALLDRLGGVNGGGKIEPSDIYLDKRKVGEVTYEYIQERERGRGK